ncbi:tRNA(Arg) A34 adenosine deaminase TadA [Herbihabitans rhizosphaerae]|uniref:tRNA(Arg) A34 adenosine deaminase TadA n=1 Tax=Herbihabitans rhizosphaerae TaxID=1872711 RepID=A0A4Q7KJI6_9PSEU|nr:nucleoside deaminase [Herbihabitans rhizosphaerae]RZS36344.1 tRNA(Arg) A34 adenosine deaminase TadA [Herbihabitans rhizosphaerae]
MSVQPDLRPWLDRAVEIATKNVADGGGPFGAMIIRGSELISVGVNRVTRDLDPTAHAEVVAIREACRKLSTFTLDGCVLVTSCEPCPLCLASALWARLDRVVFAADRYDAAKAGFDDLAFYELFESPRDTWDVPVAQLAVGAHDAPFEAWSANPERVEY